MCRFNTMFNYHAELSAQAFRPGQIIPVTGRIGRVCSGLIVETTGDTGSVLSILSQGDFLNVIPVRGCFKALTASVVRFLPDSCVRSTDGSYLPELIPDALTLTVRRHKDLLSLYEAICSLQGVERVRWAWDLLESSGVLAAFSDRTGREVRPDQARLPKDLPGLLARLTGYNATTVSRLLRGYRYECRD